MRKTEVSWNLSDLFPSVTDPSVKKAIDSVSRAAEHFAETYQGKIAGLSCEKLETCLKEFESLQADVAEVMLYSELSFAANMTLPETLALHDKTVKMDAKIGKMLAFFELETGALVSKNPRLTSERALTNYKHTLQRLKNRASHFLSEVEEQLIIEKDQYGIRAWEELQTKWLNTRKFEVLVVGKKKTVSFGQAGGLFAHSDRATRESAYKSVYGLLCEHGEIFSSALRNICNDWLNICKRRKYVSPIQASLIENDIKSPVIDNLLKTVERHGNLYRRYLQLKAKMMRLPKLRGHDVIAPLPDAKRIKFTYEEARELVIAAYTKFDEEYASAAKEMYAKNHLDSSPRYGKQNGAFCAPWYKGKSAFILSSFNETLRDVYTLAHELGHATHDYYSQPKQTLLNLRIPMIVAETASIFGELLLTDLLISEAKSDEQKRTILCSVLDSAGNVIFKVASRAWFEQSLYNSIEDEAFLTFETICKLWTTARSRVFKNSVEWFDVMRAEWVTTPHYYMPNFRFYNYPYVYAQLFVYALYRKYLQEGRDFIPKFMEILSVGSSVSPEEIGDIVGFDIANPDFWKLGVRQYETFLKDLEAIAE
jgi:oligoendopeptidase F